MYTISIKEFIPLAPYTTMRTGGAARYFVRVANLLGVRQAVEFVRERNLPLFVLGGGSNVLVSDGGFPGLVMQLDTHGMVYEDITDGVRVVASAGEMWDDVVRGVVSKGLWGIENLSLIPGTVGGAAVQNIGAYGVEFGDVVLWVEAFDTETMTTKTFLREECAFGYRTSIFKTNKHLIVMRVAFNLSRKENPRIDYEDVKNYFLTQVDTVPTLENIRKAVVSIRTAKLPALPLGTAGSFFKNPIVSTEQFEAIKKDFPEIKAYIQGDGTVKLSAAWLLDNVGKWRGVRRGHVGVYEKQALVLVNYGGATTGEMLYLANSMKESIHKKINVTLEEEVVVM